MAEAFVVKEEEEPVRADGSAEVKTVLVAIEGGLFEGNDDAGAAGVGGLEETCGVEVGVAEEFLDGGVILVGSAVGGHVDGGAGRASVLGALIVRDVYVFDPSVLGICHEFGHRFGFLTNSN